MNNLIKNEITKILKKKSFYIILIIILAYIILANVMTKYVYSLINYNNYFSDSYIEFIKEDMKNLNLDNPDELDEYVSYKTDIDTYELLKNYDENSWQYSIIIEQGTNYISQINQYTYKDKNDSALKSAKSDYDKFIKRLDSNDWKVFATEELESLKQTQDILDDKVTNAQIETLQMRLDYDIPYGNNYKNDALSKYLNSKTQIVELENKSNKTYEEKQNYEKAKEDLVQSKYVIENDKDIFNDSNARGMLLNVFSKYELFIIITIVLIGGAIVSDEFNKGTIKLLLVRPYNRGKILLSKFITVLITTLFICITICILQFIVGSIFFGFESLKIPAIEYNHHTGKLVEMSIFKNIVLTGIGKLPMYILLGTLAFALSTLFNNTAVAIAVTLLGYMASDIINSFAYYYNLKWLKYFVTPNWDFTQFLYGNLPNMEGLSILFSAVICLIYFTIMIITSFIVFNKRNIKNV